MSKEEITIHLKFATGLITRLRMPNFKAVKQALCSSEIEMYGNWIRCDDIYQPQNAFLITDMKLNKKGKLEYLELTEFWEGGFNER